MNNRYLPGTATLALTLAISTSSHALTYSDALHAYWKLSPPESYEPFVQDYADVTGDIKKTQSRHELDVRPKSNVSANEIKKNVESTEIEPMVFINTEVKVGQYDKEKHAFAFTGFGPGHSFVENPPHDEQQTLPTITIRATNTNEIGWLPVPEEIARQMLDYASWGDYYRNVIVDVTILPKTTKPANKEIRGVITDLRVRHSNQGPTKFEGTDIAHITLDSDTGKLIKAEYTGIKPE